MFVKLRGYADVKGWHVDWDNYHKSDWKRQIDVVASHDLKASWKAPDSDDWNPCALAINQIAIDRARKISLIVSGEFTNDGQEPEGPIFHVYSVPFEAKISDGKVTFISPPINNRVFRLE